MKGLKSFIIWWDNTFPLDKKFREKYNIPFGSEAHRNTCQVDIYLDWLESQIYKEAFDEAMINYEKEENLKKGILINKRESVTTEQEQELIDNLSIGSFSSIKIE